MTGGTIPILWVVSDAKLGAYLFAPDHPEGGSKQRYLRRFGFEPDNLRALADALVAHAVGNSPGRIVVPVNGPTSPTRVVFEGFVRAPDGRDMPLRTVWEPKQPNEMHLVTAVPWTRRPGRTTSDP